MTSKYTLGLLRCYAIFLEPRAWSMHLISGIMVQGWWYLYGYAIPLFYDYYMTQRKHLTGKDHPKDHSVISNYTQDMLRCYAVFLEPRAWTMYFISGFVVQRWWYLYGYAIPLFCECGMMHGQHLIWLGNPRGDSMTSNYTLDMFRGFVAFWNQELEPCIHQWGNSPRSMRNVWICYHTVLYVFYKAWTTFDRGGYPHRS